MIVSIFKRTLRSMVYLVKQDTNLSDDIPFKEPFHRISPTLFEEVREHNSEMLEKYAI